MDSVLINELTNIGLTILVLVVGWIVIVWIDKNVFNKDRYKRSDEND